MGEKSVDEVLESLKNRIGVQIFVVTNSTTDEEKESANIWNPLLKGWIKSIEEIQNLLKNE